MDRLLKRGKFLPLRVPPGGMVILRVTWLPLPHYFGKALVSRLTRRSSVLISS